MLGLTLLVNSLEPKSDIFNDKKGRQNWLLTVNKYRPVVEKIFYLPSDESSNRKNELKEARYTFNQKTFIKFYEIIFCTMTML